MSHPPVFHKHGRSQVQGACLLLNIKYSNFEGKFEKFQWTPHTNPPKCTEKKKKWNKWKPKIQIIQRYKKFSHQIAWSNQPFSPLWKKSYLQTKGGKKDVRRINFFFERWYLIWHFFGCRKNGENLKLERCLTEKKNGSPWDRLVRNLGTNESSRAKNDSQINTSTNIHMYAYTQINKHSCFLKKNVAPK